MLHIAEEDPMSGKKRKLQKPNTNEDLKDWSEEEIFTLIREWESIENLYNVHHPKYPLRDERKRSISLLKERLQSRGINVTSPQIQKKMISLKNHFNSERRKVEASATTATKNDNSSVGSLYTPKWQYYRHLLFLRRNMAPSDSSDSGIQLPTSRNYSVSPEIETDVKYPFNSITVPPPSSINVPAIVQTPPSTPALTNNPAFIEDPAKENGFRPPLLTKDNIPKLHNHNNSDSLLNPNTDLLHHHHHTDKKLKDKSEDEIFGDMIVKMLSKIHDTEDKYMLKMRIQQDIMRTMFITRYPSGPVMSPPTSPSFNTYINSTRGMSINANYCNN